MAKNQTKHGHFGTELKHIRGSNSPTEKEGLKYPLLRHPLLLLQHTSAKGKGGEGYLNQRRHSNGERGGQQKAIL
jgi:hypothetical protein